MSLGNMTVAFIGSGVMAEAMIKGLLNDSLLPAEQIIEADPGEDHVNELSARYGLKGTTNNSMAAEAADILILWVKPQVLGHVMPELQKGARTSKLVLSIIAGAKIKTIADGVANASVVRAMPNTPAQIGQGITVWTATPEVLPPQIEQAKALIGALGDQIFLDDEKFLDMATALSGSGPAYVFECMEALLDAGVHMGV